MSLASLCNIFKAVWYGLQSASPIEHIVYLFKKELSADQMKVSSAGPMKLFIVHVHFSVPNFYANVKLVKLATFFRF